MTARVAVLGAGPLGAAVHDLLVGERIPSCVAAGVFRSADSPAAGSAGRLDDVDVLVEAAGVDAAREWLPVALDRGLDVVLCSCAVLADPAFAALVAAHRGPGRVVVPSGAIGGLDLFAAAARADLEGMQVELTTRKLPGALGATTSDEPVELFSGTAREAALAFPRTANVAVALALATTGLDRVRVRVLADRSITRTEHRVRVRSAVGDYELVARNELAPGSGGRTSAVTGWSVAECLDALGSGRSAGIVVI